MFTPWKSKTNDYRVAWIVEVDNQSLFLARSGKACADLNERYKKTEYTATAIPKEMFDWLGDRYAFITDMIKAKQQSSF